MIILFSDRNNKTEKEIIKILTACGADYISDKSVFAMGGYFSVCSLYKPAKIKIKNGTALIMDGAARFEGINLEKDIIGICEETNNTALKIFENNKMSVITVGNNSKNTITVSSFSENSIIISLQRNLRTVFGNTIYAGDYKVNLTNNYSNNAILLSFAVLLINGKIPEKF